MKIKQPPLPLHETLLCTPARLDVLPALTAPLVDWYRRSARDLPWRRGITPYRTWISEVMLQQTRVEAVKGYFARFLEALPTVEALAAIPEDALLKLWEGLGYYSRARNLQRAARLIVERHGGMLPASCAALRELPGFGEYTAGAVASIAFGIPVPAVDGNVYRVLSRILLSYADTSRPAVKAAFREAAALLLTDNSRSPGDLNQALMELGATVCLPNGPPLCERCPVAPHCAARREGCAADLPVKAAKKPRRIEERTIVLALSPDGVLLFRRPDTGLLAGMYEPLNLEGRLDAPAAGAALEALGARACKTLPLAAAKHIFSHVEWRMRGYLVYCAPFSAGNGVWADASALAGAYAVPSAFRVFFADIDRYFNMLEAPPAE